MPRFVTKRVEIEALHFVGLNDFEALLEFTDGLVRPKNEVEFEVYDRLHNTWVQFKRGDWIIKGLEGEFYPCVDSTFKAKYEPVTEYATGGVIAPHIHVNVAEDPNLLKKAVREEIRSFERVERRYP